MKIFKKVRCKAYLKKINDSVHIFMTDKNGDVISSSYVSDVFGITAKAYKFDKTKNDFVEIADLSGFEGEGVEKVYRERVEETFNGVIVGVTEVNVRGIIGTDWYEDEHREFGFCFKNITEHPKVAVVYFKNNMKRYVLLDDIEYLGGDL